jgi:cytochrome c-type biogenesis protein CcmH/NrfG
MVIFKTKKEGKMKQITTLLNELQEKLFSSTYQLQRIVVLVAIALVLAVVSFGSYYYYDRYYNPQPKSADVMLSEAEKAVQDKPDDPEVRLNLAETYMVNNRFDDAISQASSVMEAYPDNQRAWFVIGVAYALGGKPAEAVAPLEKFLAASKDVEMPGLIKLCNLLHITWAIPICV